MQALFINAVREGYSPEQCGETLTVGELMAYLEDFLDEDTPIYLKFDNGYTYGSISGRNIEEGEVEDE